MKKEFKKIETKSDVQSVLKSLLEALNTEFKYGGTRIPLYEPSNNTEEIYGFEGLSRIIWAIAADPYNNQEILHKVLDALKIGTDPDSEYYYGEIKDYDQKIVELAAIGFLFAVKPQLIKENLSEIEIEQICNYLNKSNYVEAHDCNWKLFRVMVDLGLLKIGYDFDQSKMEQHLDEIENYYVGDGWYVDGVPGEASADNYIGFAIQFYTMFYAHEMKNIDPKRSEQYQKRAVMYANDYMYYYNIRGESLAFGRSLAYRFAVASFWSMFIYTKLECDFSSSQIKSVIFNHLDYWLEQDIFDEKGLLSIGYTYANKGFAESYIAQSSTYWSMKYFLILLAEDKFFELEVDELAFKNELRVLKVPKFLIRNTGEDVICYNAGLSHIANHNQGSAKYYKFVYSTKSAFCTSKSAYKLEALGNDNMLAFTKDNLTYQSRNKSIESYVNEQYCYSKWETTDCEIETYIINTDDGHYRVHIVNAKDECICYEGGYSFELGRNEIIDDVSDTNIEDKLVYENDSNVSVIQDILGNGVYHKYVSENYVNIKYERVLIPTTKYHLQKGRTVLCNFISNEVDCKQNNIYKIDDKSIVFTLKNNNLDIKL